MKWLPVVLIGIIVMTVFMFARDGNGDQGVPAVIKSPSTRGEVVFPHQLHFQDFDLDCESCHHETDAAKLTFPHEEYFDDFWIDCKICHHETDAPKVAEACSNCHHYPMDIAEETLSPKVVIHKDCWTCHEIGKGVEASKRCEFCHTGPRSGF